MMMSTNPSATKSADSLRVSSRSSGVAQRIIRDPNNIGPVPFGRTGPRFPMKKWI